LARKQLISRYLNNRGGGRINAQPFPAAAAKNSFSLRFAICYGALIPGREFVHGELDAVEN
jgi:hypothetical protein